MTKAESVADAERTLLRAEMFMADSQHYGMNDGCSCGYRGGEDEHMHLLAHSDYGPTDAEVVDAARVLMDEVRRLRAQEQRIRALCDELESTSGVRTDRRYPATHKYRQGVQDSVDRIRELMSNLDGTT